tara:strand:+ start:305 stop:604 length:300 start_codon:yes stop_codon:yes gene_type:complete
MSWEIILKRAKTGMSPHAQKLVDRIITTTPKTIDTILDDMYNQLERDKKERQTTGGRKIPTRRELMKYLGTKYSRVRLSKRTQKPIQGKGGLMHYYREE